VSRFSGNVASSGTSGGRPRRSRVTVLATGPTGPSAVGSGPAEDGGFLWVIKIRSAHFLRRGSKAVGPMTYTYGV
jgi:hypothetical protein